MGENKRRPTWLENMTWREFADVVSDDVVSADVVSDDVVSDEFTRDNRIFVIPIGASAKEHGPHLPLNTDYLLAREFVCRVSRHRDIIAAPVISFGYYPAFVSYPGSLGISDKLFHDLVYSVSSRLAGFGVKRIAIFNTGVSTTPVLESLVGKFHSEFNIEILLLNIRDLFAAAKVELGLREDISHADRMETSLVMAIDESVVRADKIERASAEVKLNAATALTARQPLDPEDPASPSYCPSGILGDPLGASAALGNELFNCMALIIERKMRDQWPG